MNVFHFLVIFLNASQSAVEKSRLPEKTLLSSARIDAKELFLDRFHYTRDGEGETGEYERMPRRGGIGQENPRRKQKVMFLSALAHHAGQALEFGFPNHPLVRREPAGDEEAQAAESLKNETLQCQAVISCFFDKLFSKCLTKGS
jgi:hypothetical protein